MTCLRSNFVFISYINLVISFWNYTKMIENPLLHVNCWFSKTATEVLLHNIVACKLGLWGKQFVRIWDRLEGFWDLVWVFLKIYTNKDILFMSCFFLFLFFVFFVHQSGQLNYLILIYLIFLKTNMNVICKMIFVPLIIWKCDYFKKLIRIFATFLKIKYIYTSIIVQI